LIFQGSVLIFHIFDALKQAGTPDPACFEIRTFFKDAKTKTTVNVSSSLFRPARKE